MWHRVPVEHVLASRSPIDMRLTAPPGSGHAFPSLSFPEGSSGNEHLRILLLQSDFCQAARTTRAGRTIAKFLIFSSGSGGFYPEHDEHVAVTAWAAAACSCGPGVIEQEKGHWSSVDASARSETRALFRTGWREDRENQGGPLPLRM